LSGGATHPYILYGDQTAYEAYPSIYQIASKRLYLGDLSNKGDDHFPAFSVLLKKNTRKSLPWVIWMIHTMMSENHSETRSVMSCNVSKTDEEVQQINKTRKK